jgi:carboxypeptidase D
MAPEPFIPFSDRYPALAAIITLEDLQLLYQLRIDIGDLRTPDGQPSRLGTGAPFEPLIAAVYINPGEAAQLEAAGLSVVAIPNESLRALKQYGPGSQEPGGWPTYAQYVARMQALADARPDLIRLISIGKSVQNRDLWCLKVTDNPNVAEDEPEFKYSSTHHGNEPVGTEMTIRLAELFSNTYGIDPDLTMLVNEMETWLCPLYNPDGYVANNRYNAHGIDLNRNFPDRLANPDDCDPSPCEPETAAFMALSTARRFTMGANYHTGELVVNYPWDAVPTPPDYAPDDALYYDFSVGYASRNPDIWNNPFFDHGVTRGWEWYMIYGGMQDWLYLWNGEFHVTIEISDQQPPPYNQMDAYWDDNRDAMIWWMGRALTGLRGRVTDAVTGAPLDATVTVLDLAAEPNSVRTDPAVGDYHRVIAGGSYTLSATAACHETQTAPVTVISGTATVQDFQLAPTVYTLTGTVTEAGAGNPLTATVEIVGTPYITTTHPDGSYSFSDVCGGDYTIRVTAPGYHPQERPITLNSNQTQDFTLEPLNCTLLVDDDLGKSYQAYYQSALESAGQSYELWTIATQGAVPASELSQYGRVIWLTGDDYQTTLTSADQANLSTYLGQGGRLFISGQRIGYDIGTTPFYANYLHADYDSPDTNTYDLSGLDFLSGIDIHIQGAGGANNQAYPSDVAPLPGAVAVMDYPAPHLYGGIAYEDDTYRTVYFSFGFEAINDAADRRDVLADTLAWIGGCGAPNVSASTKTASAPTALPGQRLDYTLVVHNADADTQVMLTDTLPVSVTWANEIAATLGTPSYSQGLLTWNSIVTANQVVTITYAVTANACLPAGASLANQIIFDDHAGTLITRTTMVTVTNATPDLPTALTPTLGITGTPLDITLSWLPGPDLNCDALTYSAAFGPTNPPPIVATGLIAPTYDPGPLAPATTYYWQIIASDGRSQTVGAIWSFTTRPQEMLIYLPFLGRLFDFIP